MSQKTSGSYITTKALKEYWFILTQLYIVFLIMLNSNDM